MFSLFGSNQVAQVPTRDNMAPAKFFAGWYDIVLDQSDKEYIMNCYTDNQELTDTLYDAMEAYIAADYKTGDQKMNAIGTHLNVAMKDCDKVISNMTPISKKA